MTKLEDARAKMSYEVAIYKEQLNLLRKEMERISLTTLDISNAITAVTKLEKKPMLVPVGGGSYIKSTVTDLNIFVPIGADYVVEMGKEEASTELHKRIDATKDAVAKLNEEFEKINKKMGEVGTKLKDVEAQLKISQRVEEGVRDDYI
jgi:prefoldin alpha subunit